jgi:hypothetical protein
LTIDWEPLGINSIYDQVHVPAFQGMALTGISVMLAVPGTSMLQDMLEQRDNGLEKQYILAGVSISTLYLVRMAYDIPMLLIQYGVF